MSAPPDFELRHTITLSDTVLALALSPDNRWLATTAYDKKLRVRDAQTLAEVKALHVGTFPRALGFSPNSQIVVAASGTITAWETSSWKKVQGFKGHRREIARVAFSPDGTQLYSGGRSDVTPSDDTVRTWEVATGVELRRWNAFGSVSALAVSPDGASLAVATESGRTMLLDAATNAERWTSPEEARTNALAFTGDGQLLGTCHHALLFDYDLATGAQREMVPRSRSGMALAVSSDGATVFVASAHSGDPEGGFLCAVDRASRSVVWRRSLGTTIPRGVQISRDGARLYVVHTQPDRILVYERS